MDAYGQSKTPSLEPCQPSANLIGLERLEQREASFIGAFERRRSTTVFHPLARVANDCFGFMERRTRSEHISSASLTPLPAPSQPPVQVLHWPKGDGPL